MKHTSDKPNNAIGALNICNNDTYIQIGSNISNNPRVSVVSNVRIFSELNLIKTYLSNTISEVLSINTLMSNMYIRYYLSEMYDFLII